MAAITAARHIGAWGPGLEPRSRRGVGAGRDDSFWRSLWYFSIYRFAIAILFFAAAMIFGDTISLGTQDARCSVVSRLSTCWRRRAFW
jgi:hypothetical protein